MLKENFSRLALFAVPGISVSREMMIMLGLGTNYFAIGIVGLVLAFMLRSRSIILIILVTILTIGIIMPDESLQAYGLSKTLLIGLFLCLALFPTMHKMLNN